MEGYKFDLRLYALVTSFQPLEAFLYAEGFARFSARKYSTREEDIGDLFVHLTNSSIQKQLGPDEEGGGFSAASVVGGGGGGPAPDGGLAGLEGGSKCSVSQLFERLRGTGVNTAALWERIQDLVLRSLFAVQDAVPHHPNAFELLGFDVLVDRALKPWLIEVNASPSLGVDNPLDARVKGALLRDVVSLVDPVPFDRHALLEVLQRRTGGRHGSSSRSGTLAEERARLNADLEAVLRGRRPRRYGEALARPGAFQQLAPSKRLDALLRLKRPPGGGGGVTPSAAAAAAGPAPA